MTNRLTKRDLLILEACTGFPFLGDVEALRDFIQKTLDRPLASIDLAIQTTYTQCRYKLATEFKQTVAKMRNQADIKPDGLSDYYKEDNDGN